MEVDVSCYPFNTAEDSFTCCGFDVARILGSGISLLSLHSVLFNFALTNSQLWFKIRQESNSHEELFNFM